MIPDVFWCARCEFGVSLHLRPSASMDVLRNVSQTFRKQGGIQAANEQLVDSNWDLFRLLLTFCFEKSTLML